MVNEWTRDDLPDASVATDKYGAIGQMYFPAVDDYRDAVVAHLNANGGLPASDDRWRRAHSIVEQERDQARESLRRLRAETDFDLFTVRDQLKQCRGEREQMTRDRDEWKARAEAAERERDAAEYAEAEMERERDEWKARADEWHGEWQKIAPARTVTRDDIEKAISELRTFPRFLTDELLVLRDEAVDVAWALVSGEAEPADPVEAKARELWEVARFNDSDEWSCLIQVERDCYRRMAAHVLGQEAGDE